MNKLVVTVVSWSVKNRRRKLEIARSNSIGSEFDAVRLALRQLPVSLKLGFHWPYPCCTEM